MLWLQQHTALGTRRPPIDHRHLGQDPEPPLSILDTHLLQWHTVLQWIWGLLQTLADRHTCQRHLTPCYFSKPCYLMMGWLGGEADNTGLPDWGELLSAVSMIPVPVPWKAMHMPQGTEPSYCGALIATPVYTPLTQGSPNEDENWKLQCPAPDWSP